MGLPIDVYQSTEATMQLLIRADDVTVSSYRGESGSYFCDACGAHTGETTWLDRHTVDDCIRELCLKIAALRARMKD